MLMKKFITLLLVLTGMVTTASAAAYDRYWIVGTVPGTDWTNAPNDWEMSTTDGNIYTLLVEDVDLEEGESYEFKARNKQNTWDGATAFGKDTGNNQSYSVTADGTYDLYFVANFTEKKVALILFNKLQVKGGFESWTGTDMTKKSTYSYSYTIDLSSADVNDDQAFKLFVDAPGRNIGEDGYIGNDKVQISQLPTPLLVDGSNNYLIPANLVKGYKKFLVTATWGLCTSIEYNWTITVEPKEPRDGYSKVLFDNDANYTGNIFAYSWIPAEPVTVKNANWPGEKIAKVNGLYNYFYDPSASYTRIIFNNKADGSTGSQTGDLTFTANKVYNSSGTVGAQTVSIGTDGYATFSSKYPLNFPDGDEVDVKAYKASIDGSSVKMTRVTGGVPANTGLFVQKISDVATVTVDPVATETADVTSNLLKPTTGGDIYDSEKYQYVFAKQGGELAFYQVTGSLSPAAGKAYLETESAIAARLAFDFEDENTTGIQQVATAQKNVEGYYNLAGQRVAQPTKGLYIVNGKKVVIK